MQETASVKHLNIYVTKKYCILLRILLFYLYDFFLVKYEHFVKTIPFFKVYIYSLAFACNKR